MTKLPSTSKKWKADVKSPVRGMRAATTRFNGIGYPAPTEEAVVDAAKEVVRQEESLRALEHRRQELNRTVGTQQEAQRAAQERLIAADEKLTSERREAEPATRRWSELHDRAQRHGLIGNLLGNDPDGPGGIRGHVNLVQIATARRDVLLERLHNARGGDALLSELELVRSPSADAAFADPILELWLAVRDWLRHRLPAQVAEVDDPREALHPAA